MTALLDTHVLIWAGRQDHRISAKGRGLLSAPNSVIYVSAASAWEIATKVRLGKLPEAVQLEADFINLVVGAGYKLLPISTEDALRSGRLPGDHRDPWDRMIAAQALALDIPVISGDIKLDGFGVTRIW